MFLRPELPKLVLAALAVVSLTAATEMDPINPTCPLNPNWSANPTMKLTVEKRGTMKVILAEGRVDSGLPDRLNAALKANPDVSEIWLRSPGGDARAGNAAGRIIRSNPGLATRIPSGWACFSACNFVFMGGAPRLIEPGGEFIVHMFTSTGDRSLIDESVAMGTDATTELIGDVEQDSALLASEEILSRHEMRAPRNRLANICPRKRPGRGGAPHTPPRRCLTLDEALKYGVTYAVE